MSILGGNPNILLIIADDLGQDVVEIGRLFGLTQAEVPTGLTQTAKMRLTPKRIRVVTNDGTVQITGELPNVSRFLRNGVYFEQAWAQPSCSPTRASIYTGLHPWKSGVGSPTEQPPTGPPELDPSFSSTTLPTLLPSEYVSGLFGKWHLGEVFGTRPTEHGWDKHVGTLGGVLPTGTPPDNTGYTDWNVVDSDNDYTLVPTTDYATRRTVKEAGAWINAQDPATPWFATIAFHTPHDPFHIPPHGYDTATAGDPTTEDYMFNVMTQNMDTNIGRLLGTSSGGGAAALDFDPIPGPQLENTVIIFIGDNGSHEEIAIDEEKTFIYEGSVRVPMIIADGQAVMNEINSEAIAPRFLHASRLDTENQYMVNAVDLYMTIARLADPSVSGFPSNTDSMDLRSMFTTLKLPTAPRRLDPVDPGDLDPPLLSVRPYNFSQWYTDTQKRATIRNSSYKLNYNNNPAMPEYALYQYSSVGRIPDREDDGTAVDLFADAINGVNLHAQENLNLLLDELIANYQRDEASAFPDPR